MIQHVFSWDEGCRIIQHLLYFQTQSEPLTLESACFDQKIALTEQTCQNHHHLQVLVDFVLGQTEKALSKLKSKESIEYMNYLKIVHFLNLLDIAF